MAILSGMLEGQDQDVIDVMGTAGLPLKEKVIEGKWVTLLLVPQNNSAIVP
jgi:ribosomal protein L11 methylase PrmA